MAEASAQPTLEQLARNSGVDVASAQGYKAAYPQNDDTAVGSAAMAARRANVPSLVSSNPSLAERTDSSGNVVGYGPTPPGSGVVGSSSDVLGFENGVTGVVKDLSAPTSSSEAARKASGDYLAQIDQQVSDLERRRRDTVDVLNRQFDSAKASTQEAQKNEKASTNSALVRIGGYLGTDTASVGVLNNLAKSQRAEIGKLEADRAAAILAAETAISDKQFDLALRKAQEAKDLEKTIYERSKDSFNQLMTLQAAERDGFERTINSLAASDVEPPESTFLAMDQMNGYVSGVSKGAYELARQSIASKRTNDDLTNFSLLADTIAKLRPDQQITVGGRTYSGTLNENEFKGYEVDQATGDVATVTYNKRTGETRVVNQKGVLTPNVKYDVTSVKNADGSTSLWQVDPSRRSPAVPVLGMENGGAQQGVNLGVLQTAYPAGFKPAGTQNGWCLEFVNSLILDPYAAGTLNSIDQKRGAVDASISMPSVGDLVFTNEDSTYGHVAIINSILTDPDTGRRVAILTESNFSTDGRGNGVVGHTRKLDIDPSNMESAGGKILGYARVRLRPELGSQLVRLGDAADASKVPVTFDDATLASVSRTLSKSLPNKDARDRFAQDLAEAAATGDMDQVRQEIETGVFLSSGMQGRNSVIARNGVIDGLEEAKRVIEAYEAKNGSGSVEKKLGLIPGNTEKVLAKLGQSTDPELRQLAVFLQPFKMDYRRSQTGVAFSEKESSEYDTLFPDTLGKSALQVSKIDGLIKAMRLADESMIRTVIGDKAYRELYGDTSTGQDISSQARAKGYDYDAMRADGLTDRQIKEALGL